MSKKINEWKRLAMILALGTSVSMTGCSFSTPNTNQTQIDYTQLQDVTDEERKKVPNNVDKCFEYRITDGKSEMAYKKNNIFLAYNPETDEMTAYLKYEFFEEAKDLSFGFGDKYHYVQLYDVDSLNLIVNACPNIRKCRGINPYKTINGSYYSHLVGTCDVISLEEHDELQDTYTDEELDVLKQQLKDVRYKKYEKNK